MKITILSNAEIDLFEIWDYIADDSFVNADKVLVQFHELFSVLAENPAMGRVREDIGFNIRSFPVGKYVIFYRAFQPGIEVLRVLHSARDITNVFE